MRVILKQPFAEQVAFFRNKLGTLMPTQRWDDLWQQEHDRAFMVAGAMKADLLSDLASAVDATIAQGQSIDWFRTNFDSIVNRHGWAYHGERNWRTRVIYQTNMASSYAAGRLAQLKEGGFAKWMYKHSDSVMHPRPHHVALDGLVLPADHPFWATHYPPNGWGCQCRVVGVESDATARALGGDPDKELPPGWDDIDPGTGAPVGIDKGWAYQPGASVVDQVRMLATKLSSLPVQLGQALGSMVMGSLRSAWPHWVEETLSGARHEPGLLAVLTAQDVQALAEAGLELISAEVLVRPGLLIGPKATRHAQAGNALSVDQWHRLPDLFASQNRMLLRDVQSGKLLAVIPDQGGNVQLAMQINFQEKKPKRTGNMVVSAYQTTMDNIRQRVLRGDLAIVQSVE